MHISLHGIKSNIAHTYNAVANQIGYLAKRTVNVITSNVSAVAANEHVRQISFVAAVVGLTQLSIMASEKLEEKLFPKDKASLTYLKDKGIAERSALLLASTLPTIAMVAYQAIFNKSQVYAINPRAYLIQIGFTTYAISSVTILAKSFLSKTLDDRPSAEAV